MSDEVDLRSVLVSTNVGELTLTTRPSLAPDDTVAAASAEMRSASHGSAIVFEDGRVAGIFTERDLMRFIAGSGDLDSPLRDVMTPNPTTVSPDTSLFDAIRSMDQGGYRRLPVADPEKGQAGMLDVKDITQFLVELFPGTVYNQASHDQLIARNPEGA